MFYLLDDHCSTTNHIHILVIAYADIFIFGQNIHVKLLMINVLLEDLIDRTDHWHIATWRRTALICIFR